MLKLLKMFSDFSVMLKMLCDVTLLSLFLCFVMFLRLKYCCPNAGEKVKFEVKPCHV